MNLVPCSGLDMVCCTPSGVVGENFVNIKEVFRQVHWYLGGVTNPVDQNHCKMLYTVVNPKPFQPVKMGMGEVGSIREAK